MVATVNGQGTNIALLSATDLSVAANAKTPLGRLTAGEGAVGHLRVVEDVVALDAAGLADTGSYYRAARIPSNAKIKRVEVRSDTVLDSNAISTLQLGFGVGWSDAKDGTPVDFRGKVPAAAKNGTNVVATDAGRNKLFGSIDKSTTDNTPIPLTDITFNGDIPTTYGMLEVQQTPVEAIFNFVAPTGYDKHGIGFIDILVNVETAAATAVAGNLFIKVEYVV